MHLGLRWLAGHKDQIRETRHTFDEFGEQLFQFNGRNGCHGDETF
jgi:hypothetical protein